MPRADTESDAPRTQTADIAEHFTARDPSGQVVVIEKRKAEVRENGLQGMEWSDGGPHYQLQGGGAVERVDESTFRVASTGKVLRREEGQHGPTHHPEHLTAGRP